VKLPGYRCFDEENSDIIKNLPPLPKIQSAGYAIADVKRKDAQSISRNCCGSKHKPPRCCQTPSCGTEHAGSHAWAPARRAAGSIVASSAAPLCAPDCPDREILVDVSF